MRDRADADDGAGGATPARGKLSAMLLLCLPETATLVNPAHVAVFYVRRFSDSDPTRAGAVVTASVVYPQREQKYRLTPLLSNEAAAAAALTALSALLTSDITGTVSWGGGGWTVEPGLG